MHFRSLPLFVILLLSLPGCGKEDALGEQTYVQRCAACHDRGLAGAPQTGNREQWRPIIAQGTETLISRSIEGYTGTRGWMPPRGGHPDLADDEVAAAVRHMITKSR